MYQTGQYGIYSGTIQFMRGVEGEHYFRAVCDEAGQSLFTAKERKGKVTMKILDRKITELRDKLESYPEVVRTTVEIDSMRIRVDAESKSGVRLGTAFKFYRPGISDNSSVSE